MSKILIDEALAEQPAPAQPWVGLTNEDFVELCSANLRTVALIRAVETNLKEKNTSVKATEKGGAA